MRRSLITFFAFIAILLPMTVLAVPQVAVLDAVVPEDMDASVIIPITDKISEELVNSGKYMVLDRASVEQVLREKEFQLSSGLVKTDEIRRAGEYLGADFVVVARASKVGATFFLSARMIDVKSGAITAQTSVERPGSIDVLLALAKTVGNRLAGGVVEKVAEDKLEGQKPAQTTPPARTVAQREKPAREVPTRVIGVKGGISGTSLGAGLTPGSPFLDTYSGAWIDFTEYWAGSRFLGGAYVSTKIGRKLGLEADVLLVQKGFDATVEYYDSSLIYLDTAEEEWIYNYLEIPLLVKFYLHERTQFYIGGGAFFAYLLGGMSDRFFNLFIDDSVSVEDRLDHNPIDYGVVLSLGMDLPVRNYIINLEARYTMGFATFLNPDIYIDQPTHSVLSLIVGFGYGL